MSDYILIYKKERGYDETSIKIISACAMMLKAISDS